MISKKQILSLLEKELFLTEGHIYSFYAHSGYKYPFVRLERQELLKSFVLSDGRKELKYYCLSENSPELNDFSKRHNLKLIEKPGALKVAKPVLNIKQKLQEMTRVIEERPELMLLQSQAISEYSKEISKEYYRRNRLKIIAKNKGRVQQKYWDYKQTVLRQSLREFYPNLDINELGGRSSWNRKK